MPITSANSGQFGGQGWAADLIGYYKTVSNISLPCLTSLEERSFSLSGLNDYKGITSEYWRKRVIAPLQYLRSLYNVTKDAKQKKY